MSVALAGGGTAEFGVFYNSASSGDYLWYEVQSAPGGAYGPWSQVLTAQLNSQYPVLSAAQDANGSLEVFTMESESSTIVRTVQTTPGGPWSTPTAFGPGGAGIPLYFGYPYLFKLQDGSLAYFAVYEESSGTQLFVTQQNAAGVWGAWTDLGAGPEPEPVGVPTSVTESANGTLTAVAHLWNASTGYYCEISQLTADGAWGQWVECATNGCV